MEKYYEKGYKNIDQNYVDMRNQLLETGATEEEIAQYFYYKLRERKVNGELFLDLFCIIGSAIFGIGLFRDMAINSQDNAKSVIYGIIGIGNLSVIAMSATDYLRARLVKNDCRQIFGNIEYVARDRQKQKTHTRSVHNDHE